MAYSYLIPTVREAQNLHGYSMCFISHTVHCQLQKYLLPQKLSMTLQPASTVITVCRSNKYLIINDDNNNALARCCDFRAINQVLS